VFERTHQVKGGLMEKLFRVGFLIAGLIAAIMLIQQVTISKFTKLKESQMLTSQDVVTVKMRENQLECLAMNIYREAGHESFEGKVAVAQVTMNRASHPLFPKDVCGVVYQKSVFVDKVVCQFSWYCETATKARPINKVAYNESMSVAKKVLLEGFRLDTMKEALYYHANYVNPQWNLEKIGSIGNHIFYKGKR
jgi:spore germination cell wall hydrolase CwlJ-like protein